MSGPLSTGQRELFQIPEGVTYLNCANRAPQLRSVAAAGLNAVADERAPWTRASADWFTGAERLRRLFADLVNGDPGGVALVPGVSYGVAVAAANAPVHRGQTIVLAEREFPSGVYAWRDLADRAGARVRTVAREADGSWTDAVLSAIDASTAVVAVPNCHWTDGTLFDLVRIGEAARSAGAVFVVDASQSLGAWPLDVAAVAPDFLVTVGYKWLLGPYGLGYLYVAPRWREGRPLEHSWLTRAGAEDFTSLTTYTDARRAGARRFDAGEFPQFVLTPMATAALEQVAAWGVDRIQQALEPLTRRAIEDAGALGGAVPRTERVGHMAGIRMVPAPGRELLDRLAAQRIHVSVRGDGIRVAPHLYNDLSDVARLTATLAERCRV
jgi:selenocysteine lyase/cysteine desulfurase